MKKEYSNGEVTIVWKPDMCIHSANCVNGLPGVFDTSKKPWVDAEGATTNEIIDQVKKCPSGALSYYLNDSKNEKQSKNMSESSVTAQVLENGPLMVKGEITVTHKDGSLETKSNAAFCRCGHSNNKPFCDGSHKAEGFVG